MAQQCTGCGRLDTEPLGLNQNGEPYLTCCPDNNYKEILKTNNMENQFIPYEQALELKELGFDEPCFGYYHTTLGSNDVDLVISKTPDRFYHLIRIPENFDTLAPLYQQAFRWFREKYGIVAEIGINYYTTERKYGYKLYFLNEKSHSASYPYYHLNFEEAELACLKKLIEIVKNKIICLN